MIVADELTIEWKRINDAIKDLIEEKRQIRKVIKEIVPAIKFFGPRKPRSDKDKNKERGEQIVSLFKEGKTLQEIGDVWKSVV